MKSFKITILLLFNISFFGQVKAGTCTADSFTARSANTILTSTVYNSNHQTIYDRLNGNLDGGCISDGTLEDGALNTTDYAVILNAPSYGR